MVRNITAIRARQNLGEVLNETYYRGDAFIVERAGKPVAAIVPIGEFRKFERERGDWFDRVAVLRARNRKSSPARLENEVAQAVKSVREARAKNA